MCFLCREAEEDLHHVFIHCKYVQAFWQTLRGWSYISSEFKGNDLDSVLRSWFALCGNKNTFPLFLIWCIWKARNAGIFEDALPSVFSSATRVFYHRKGQPRDSTKAKARRISFPVLDEGIIHGFIDGASHPGTCGAGIFCYIRRNDHVKIQVGIGKGDGLKAELLALRCLLWFARRRGYSSLNIYGDSQMVNWFNGIHTIRTMILEP